MTRIELLKKAGCDTETAIKRCDDDEDFFLELVDSALEEERYQKLEAQIKNCDWKGAFESAHALKGIAINLSLNPITEAAVELTEKLRPQQSVDCGELVLKLSEVRKMLLEN